MLEEKAGLVLQTRRRQYHTSSTIKYMIHLVNTDLEEHFLTLPFDALS